MEKGAKKQNLWGLIVIAAILSGLSYWTYTEVANDYLSVERSNKMVASLLENQTKVVRGYANQVKSFERNLAQAEQKIAQIQAENSDLKVQVVSLENVSVLEQRIADLEAANAALKDNIDKTLSAAQSRERELTAKLQEYLSEYDFKNADEARMILSKYKKKISEVKSRIKSFQVEERNESIAAFKSLDAARLSLGNNGYLYRNGQETAVNLAWPPALPKNKNVQIDVTFVK